VLARAVGAGAPLPVAGAEEAAAEECDALREGVEGADGAGGREPLDTGVGVPIGTVGTGGGAGLRGIVVTGAGGGST
jgi:hypothetical protein